MIQPKIVVTTGSAKQALRHEAKARRAEAALAEESTQAGEALRDQFLNNIPFADTASIAGYIPIQSEIDCLPLLRALSRRGHNCALPCIIRPRERLQFREWAPGMTLIPGFHGIAEPPATAPLIIPQLVLVPLLAFDRRGRRLGYGGGYYDRTLAWLEDERDDVLVVGLAFAVQEVAEVPDEAATNLDWVVTPEETIAIDTRPRRRETHEKRRN